LQTSGNGGCTTRPFLGLAVCHGALLLASISFS
jgi:hypothetical protein